MSPKGKENWLPRYDFLLVFIIVTYGLSQLLYEKAYFTIRIISTFTFQGHLRSNLMVVVEHPDTHYVTSY